MFIRHSHELLSILVLLILSVSAAPEARAATSGFTTLNVNGEDVTIYRDEYGVPHIFAETNRGLFEAYGYSVAQDRLWQLELNRRAARGTLAEIFGAAAVNSDRSIRTVGYTNSELDAQFAMLEGEEQEIFTSYVNGINRYLVEVIASDPAKLPFEFYALGITPQPWTIRDSIAFGIFMVRRFGEIGGREITNQQLLASLVAMHGPSAGYAIFNDVRWINEPDSPVTVPTSGAIGNRQKPSRSLNSAQLPAATGIPAADDGDVIGFWESIGVPTKLGSYGWVVSAARSTSGFAMLYGGPQMGFSAPEVLHDVQLKGGNGFNVTGMAFAGVPPVLIGRNDHVAWTSTTATGDNLDHYIETLCGGGTGYVFNGACLPFQNRLETINVRGGATVVITVSRSVHGPVVAGPVAIPGGQIVYTQKRAHWQREMESVHGFFGFNRARNLVQFESAVNEIPTSHNFFYADKSGNIAYWQAGKVPVRPAGFDARLPFPGGGSAEWPGGVLPVPRSINPAQGYLANWNNKPSVDYDNADNQIFGKQFRLLDISDRLRTGMISLDDMRNIPKDIARVKGLGREARYLKPYLVAALNAVPPAHPLSGQAKALVEAWDGNAFADAITSTNVYAGEVIFSAWLDLMIRNTFIDELGSSRVGEASSNMLLHCLDFALTGSSGVPPTRDYFNGSNPNLLMSQTFDQVVAALAASLGPNPSTWTAPRGVINFTHPIVGVVATIPNSNRATYAQIVLLSRPKIVSENIFTLGQSGFLQFVPPASFAFDSHFKDLNNLYRLFQYKPMHLYQNVQLKE